MSCFGPGHWQEVVVREADLSMAQQAESSSGRCGTCGCIGQQGVASRMRSIDGAIALATPPDCCTREEAWRHCVERHTRAATEASDHSTALNASAMAKRERSDPPAVIDIRVHPPAAQSFANRQLLMLTADC